MAEVDEEASWAQKPPGIDIGAVRVSALPAVMPCSWCSAAEHASGVM